MSYDNWKTTERYDPYSESEPECVRCDGCEMWVIDGAPENGRIGKGYYCPRCYGDKLAALGAVTVDFHDEVRR